MINLTPCQRKKLLNSIKNNKSIFIKLKTSQVKELPKNPFIKIKQTKNGYSLNIENNDFDVIGGHLNNIFKEDLNEVKNNKSQFHQDTPKYQRCIKCVNCEKCYGKGMMRI